MEIADEIGISQAQVSRLEKGAMDKIKTIVDTSTVVGEKVLYSNDPDTDISIYTLQYGNTVRKGYGSQTSTVRLIGTKDAFEVGDKLQIVKIEK